jgi:hypothetical protein
MPRGILGTASAISFQRGCHRIYPAELGDKIAGGGGILHLQGCIEEPCRLASIEYLIGHIWFLGTILYQWGTWRMQIAMGDRPKVRYCMSTNCNIRHCSRSRATNVRSANAMRDQEGVVSVCDSAMLPFTFQDSTILAPLKSESVSSMLIQ